MQVRNHGKYTKMRKNNPRGIATCDYSGLMVQHRVMKEQYQYRGNGLVKTGYLVHPKFLDEPNPQDLTPLIKADPVPLKNPRPDSYVEVDSPQVLELDVSGNTNVVLTQEQAANPTYIFTGVLTGNVIIEVPGGFNEFYVTNKTTGAFELSIQLINNSGSLILLIPNETKFICNTSETLLIIPIN